MDFLVVQAYDQYVDERYTLLGASGSDFLLVNIFRGVLGAPMTLEAIYELFERLTRRAGLSRRVGSHMVRRAFGSNVSDAGGKLDEVHALLGQKPPSRPAPT
ncbi:tyrosine-type recombinase/integrase [Streptomyces chartreusis]|uniref:tyrosine-type recombinase/integrase n=1 Tax=Streptomyces chartreusis TaxID=1969 RepID=UPI00369C0444